MTMHRQRSRQRTRVAQAAVVVLLCAGAAAALLLQGAPAQALALTPVDPGQNPTPTPAAGTNVDPSVFPLIAGVMSTSVDVRDRPVVAAVTPEAVPEKDPGRPAPLDAPDATQTGGWRYVGTIVSPRNTAAIVVDESGKQHILFTGDTLNGVTVVSASSEHIVVKGGSEGGAERTLEIEPRPEMLLPDATVVTSWTGPSGNIDNEKPTGFDQWAPDAKRAWYEQQAQRMRETQRSQSGGSSRLPPNRPNPAMIPPRQMGKDPKSQ